jgi:two-component system response regulator PrrA
MAKALVIDDQRLAADTLCQLLTLFDIQARPAYGARAGMLALQEQIPDVILLDIAMPGLNGHEILAYLRREPRLGRIPVVIVTADDSPGTADQARQEGAVDVIVKPATLEAIENALKVAKIL